MHLDTDTRWITSSACHDHTTVIVVARLHVTMRKTQRGVYIPWKSLQAAFSWQLDAQAYSDDLLPERVCTNPKL